MSVIRPSTRDRGSLADQGMSRATTPGRETLGTTNGIPGRGSSAIRHDQLVLEGAVEAVRDSVGSVGDSQPAAGEESLDRLARLVVGRRGARCEAHLDGPFGKPSARHDLIVAPQWLVADRLWPLDARRIVDVIGRDDALADPGEVVGVARVVTA